MKKALLFIAPLSMLALAACNKSETPAAQGDAANGADVAAAAPAAVVPMPPAITSSAAYRCADGSVVQIDILGANEAANIRVGAAGTASIRVEAAKAAEPAPGVAAPAEAKPAGPLKSADGKTMLSLNGKQVNLKLDGKGAQSCKS